MYVCVAIPTVMYVQRSVMMILMVMMKLIINEQARRNDKSSGREGGALANYYI